MHPMFTTAMFAVRTALKPTVNKSVLSPQGKYGDAKSLLKRSIAIWEQPHRGDVFLVGSGLIRLAGFCTEEVRVVKAETIKVLGGARFWGLQTG